MLESYKDFVKTIAMPIIQAIGRISLLKNKFVVDRLHKQGHKDPTCHATNHPDLFPCLNKLNAEVCTQINSWLAGFKYNVKQMNWLRYVFFLFCDLDYFNTCKLSDNNIAGDYFKKRQGIKRNYSDTSKGN